MLRLGWKGGGAEMVRERIRSDLTLMTIPWDMHECSKDIC